MLLLIIIYNVVFGFPSVPDTCDSYCLVTLYHPMRTKGSGHTSPKVLSPKLSPKTSQRISPTSTPPSSPHMLRPDNCTLKSGVTTYGSKGNVCMESDFHRTSTVKSSSHPKWNEEFTL